MEANDRFRRRDRIAVICRRKEGSFRKFVGRPRGLQDRLASGAVETRQAHSARYDFIEARRPAAGAEQGLPGKERTFDGCRTKACRKPIG